MKPNTAVPPGVRVSASSPNARQTTMGGPGAGAGTRAWNTATAVTEAATQTVAASAPQRVLPRQKRAATSSGDSAAKPLNAYWMASEKMLSGASSAMK